MNGEDSFAWNIDGSSVYGMSSSMAFITAAIIGSGERYVNKTTDGEPYFALETERFYSVADKLATLASSDGEFICRNNSGRDHYEMIFKERRALFMGAELKASSRFRDFEDSFGIVPIPKLDAEQESYYSVMSKATCLMAIPIMNEDTERAGIIMDAFSYLSHRDILPVYYDVRLSQKGLRNEESIEMLEIISGTRYCDVGDAYGWTSTLQNDIRKALSEGTDNTASIIAAAKSSVNEKISATLKALK